MRYMFAALALVCLACLAGCARYPTGVVTSTVPAQTIYSEITVAGNINPAYYYFFAIDTRGISSAGPVPVTIGTGFGNGWGTLSDVSPTALPHAAALLRRSA